MTKRLGIAEALREAIAEEMERDERVFCIGEDIAVPGGWGGAFTVTLGLEKQVPRPHDQHADRRAGLLRRRLRRGDDGHAADRRRAVRRLPAAGRRPDHQQHRQDALHVGRADHGAAGDAGAAGRHRPRQPARPEPGALFHRRAGHQGRRRLQRLRRQGHPQGGRARRQSR